MSFLIEVKNTLILIPHIPKTGGYSFRNYLRRSFKSNQQQAGSNRSHFCGPDDDRCLRVNIDINGHIPLIHCQGTMQRVYGDSLKKKRKILVNVVRNPYSWMKSWFFYTPKLINTRDFKLEKTKMFESLQGNFPEYLRLVSKHRDEALFENRGRPTKRYQQMVDWCKESFPFDEKHFIETADLPTKLPAILDEFATRETDGKVVHENSSASNSMTNEKMYNDETRSIVEEMFKDDIDFFGFKWEDYKDSK